MGRKIRSKVFCKVGLFKNFAKFTGKKLSHSLFCDKVAGLQSVALLKRDSITGPFLCILQRTSPGHCFLIKEGNTKRNTNYSLLFSLKEASFQFR